MAKPRLDIAGKRFGRLVADKIIGSTYRGTVWRCLCDCGNAKDVPVKDLRTGHTKSCGCLNREMGKSRIIALASGNLIDMTGQQIGRLYVCHLVRIAKRRAAFWFCQCECGNTTVVRGDMLRTSEVQSCGCWHAEVVSNCMTERFWNDLMPFIGAGPIDLSLLSLDKEW
jgi:hypothetical protein